MLFFIDICNEQLDIKRIPSILNKVSARIQQLIDNGNIKDGMYEEITDGDRRIGEWEYMSDNYDEAHELPDISIDGKNIHIVFKSQH